MELRAEVSKWKWDFYPIRLIPIIDLLDVPKNIKLMMNLEDIDLSELSRHSQKNIVWSHSYLKSRRV